jgi:hypothetical protein
VQIASVYSQRSNLGTERLLRTFGHTFAYLVERSEMARHTKASLAVRVCPHGHKGESALRYEYSKKRDKFYWVVYCMKCCTINSNKSSRAVRARKELEAFKLMGTC